MSAVVVARAVTDRGELVLRYREDSWEIISNGVFLMDSSGGTSERLLVSTALERCAATTPRVLIGGLGLGFSLDEAVQRPAVAAIDVIEIEPQLLDWHRHHLGELTGGALADPRVSVHIADLSDVLSDAPPAAWDAICIDTDNGPYWLVADGNARLYDDGGLALLRSRLAPGGTLAVWGARFDEEYDARLRAAFEDVTVLKVPRPRGEPDVVWLATAAGATIASYPDLE